MPRKFADWIDTFCEFVEPFDLPYSFGLWGGISAIAGALERKMWARSRRGVLYPNLYVFLVAPPGIGKSLISDEVRKLWGDLKDHVVAPESITSAALIDCLVKADRRIVMPKHTPPVVSFNSLLIAINELDVMLPGYDTEMMSTLTAMYDCKAFDQMRRTKSIDIKLPNVQLNILAATTPSQIDTLLPESAWQKGFLSRVIIVHDGEIKYDNVFDPDDGEGIQLTAKQEALRKKLLVDLQHVGELYGEIKFTKEASEAMNNWNKGRRQPIPDHPKLQHYNTRRVAHLIKLCMVASMSESDEPVVEIKHYNRAMGWMLQAEEKMPDLFKAMTFRGDKEVIKELWFYCLKRGGAEKPIEDALLYAFLSERVAAYQVENILNVMIQMKIFKQAPAIKGISGRSFYVREIKEL